MRLRIRTIITEELNQGLAWADTILAEEMRQGLDEAGDQMAAAVRSRLVERGMVSTGELIETVRKKVTGRQIQNLKAIVSAGTRGRGKGFYAAALQWGATIKPLERRRTPGRNVQYLTFQVDGRWVKVREVRLQPRPFVTEGRRLAYPNIQKALRNAAQRAFSRIYAERKGT